MDISKLLATTGTSSSDQPGLKGSADSGFAQVFKQAGKTPTTGSDASMTLAASSDATLGGKKSALLDALSSKGGIDDAKLDELLADESMLNEILADVLPGELTPLAQQINQATDGLAHVAALPATEQGLAQNLAQIQDALKSVQAEHGVNGEELAEIRQRLDMIASAQRGETMSASDIAGNSIVGHGRSQSDVAQSTLAARNDVLGDIAGLRHQQLTAQGMQVASQQEAATANGQAPVNFTEAVAALSREDTLTAGRSGGESTSHGSLSLIAPNANSVQSGNSQPQPGTPLPSQTLSAPLASAQWQQGLGQQLLALHQRGGQQVDLHLHPAELGPLTVSLKVDDQIAQAQFFSANPHVRSAVEQAIPQLREALQESGIQLGEAMVGEHQQRGDSNEQHQGNGTLARGSVTGSLTGDDNALLTPVDASRMVLEPTGIDLYA